MSKPHDTGHLVSQRRVTVEDETTIEMIALVVEGGHKNDRLYQFLVEDGALQAVRKAVDDQPADTWRVLTPPETTADIPRPVRNRLVDVMDAGSWLDIAGQWGDTS